MISGNIAILSYVRMAIDESTHMYEIEENYIFEISKIG